MATGIRRRRVGSISSELVRQSREAALAAVQTFNNPLIQFKSESFIVLMKISWTYLLHAYYRKRGVEYRYFRMRGNRRIFEKTKRGAHKYWELERCLNDAQCPLDRDTINNLRFLIGLRHEIEHQMSMDIDNYLSSRYQACALNYCRYIETLFGPDQSITDRLAFSIQFSAISLDQVTGNTKSEALPANVKNYIVDFDQALSDEEFNSERFAFRVYFLRRLVNRRGQADSVVEFIDPESAVGQEMEKVYWVVKEKERHKYRPSSVCQIMQSEGFKKFRQHEHTQLWKSLDAKDPGKGLGVDVEGQWYWYAEWIDTVRKHCEESGIRYR